MKTSDDPQLYRGERRGRFSYSIPVALEGRYTVTLKSANALAAAADVAFFKSADAANLSSDDKTRLRGRIVAEMERQVKLARFREEQLSTDKKFKAAQTGGPSGGCIPARLFDTRIDYEELVRHGAIKLAAAMFNRRNSAGAEIEAYAQFGGSPPVGLLDAEVQAFLGLGRYAGPVVA